MENWESEEEPDELVSILDQLNFKVVSKSPNDSGYFDDSSLYPTSSQYYISECRRLQGEVKQWEKSAKRCERQKSELEKKLGQSESKLTNLRGKIIKDRSAFMEVKRKLKETINSLKSNHRREFGNFKSFHDAELERNSNIIRDLQLEISRKELMIKLLQQENEKAKNDLAAKANDLKVVEGIMEEQQHALETLEEKRKSEVECLQNVMAELQKNVASTENENKRLHENVASKQSECARLHDSLTSINCENEKLQKNLGSEESKNERLIEDLANKERENERLRENLVDTTFEKDFAMNSWHRLSEVVKSCNSELEDCISSFVREYHVEIPEGSVSPEKEDEERRLQSNLNVMALLIRKTVEEFCSSHNNEEEGEEARDTFDKEPLRCDNNSGADGDYPLVDLDDNHEAEEETGIAAGSTSTRSRSSSHHSSNSSVDNNLGQDRNDDHPREQEPRQHYLPICSPISSDSSESEESLPDTSSISLEDDSSE